MAFGLYFAWDLAGAIQKRGANNRYKATWDAAQTNPARPDVVDPWTPTKWWRIILTFLGLVVSSGFLTASLNIEALHSPTRHEVVIADIAITIGLLAYRYAKDHAS